MPRPFCLLLVALSFLALSPSAHCQSTDFVPVLSGDKYPLTRKLKDLDSTWQQMSVSKASGLDAFTLLTLGRGSVASDLYYTHGQTVAISGEIFLIAYHRNYTQDEIVGFISGAHPIVPPPFPDTALALSLINLKQIASLDGIQPYTRQTGGVEALVLQKAAEYASVSNLQKLGLALTMYMQDHDVKLPPMTSISAAKTALSPYVNAEAVFEQPHTQKPYLPNTSLSYRSLFTFDNPTTTVVYYEANTAPDGKRAVLFLDGHARRVEESEWQRLKAASHIPKLTTKVQ